MTSEESSSNSSHAITVIFGLIKFGKVWNLLSAYQLLVKCYQYFPSTKMAFALNNPWRLICHWTKKPIYNHLIYTRVGWKIHWLTTVLLGNVTKWDLFVNIVPFVVHTLLSSMLQCLDPIDKEVINSWYNYMNIFSKWIYQLTLVYIYIYILWYNSVGYH